MKQIAFLSMWLFLWGCSNPQQEKHPDLTSSMEISSTKTDSSYLVPGTLTSLDTGEAGNTNEKTSSFTDNVIKNQPDTSRLGLKMQAAGLIDINTVSPNIQVNLKYASRDNFLKKNVYGGLGKCYLQPEVAKKLGKAQSFLQKKHPNLSLHVFDGARPRSVQFMMWAIVKGTDQQSYVASPKAGSMHNYGASVDLTVATLDGELLDMGTPFDFFGRLAQPRYEDKYVISGELTKKQVENRRILRSAMLEAGFHGILNEWWHFNAYPRQTIKSKFNMVE